jgi:nicotinamidase-related amidase
MDCFASTNLDFVLRARGIEAVAIVGFLTNCCVESPGDPPVSAPIASSP